MCFNNPTIYIVECISWTIKCLISLMHGVTMKIFKDCFNCELYEAVPEVLIVLITLSRLYRKWKFRQPISASDLYVTFIQKITQKLLTGTVQPELVENECVY